MSFNGSGEFAVNAVGFPVSYGAVSSDTYFNAVINELAAGLSNTICRDGQSAVTQNIPMNGFMLTGLGSPSSRTDAMSLESVVYSRGTYAGTVGGTGNAITLTPSAALTAYSTGMRYVFIASASNTGATTVNISGLGVKNLTKQFGVALSASDIISGQVVEIFYDGTQFVMLGGAYAEGTWTPSVGGSATYTTQVGRWTKIGRVVHFVGQLVINTIGTGSTTTISGLPVNAASLSFSQAVTVGDFSTLATSVVWIGGVVASAGSSVTLRSLTAAGASAGATGLLGNSSAVTFSGSYII